MRIEIEQANGNAIVMRYAIDGQGRTPYAADYTSVVEVSGAHPRR